MISSFDNLKWKIRGWQWAEKKVAQRLSSAGYHVVKNFYVYDPIHKKYAEIDVLGISGDHLIQVEVKTWQGDWNVGDFYKGRPYWYKQPQNFKTRSPIAQLFRARKILTNVINQSFFKDACEVENGFIRGVVLFERGRVLNLDDIRVQKVLKDKLIFVRNLENLNERQIENQFPIQLLKRFSDYQNHFRWRWYSKLMKKIVWNGKEVVFEWYLRFLQRKWEEKLEKRTAKL